MPKILLNFAKRTDMKVVYGAGIITGVGLTKLADKLVRDRKVEVQHVVEV